VKTPPSNPEFARFTEAMRGIMKVSKAEVIRRIEEERSERPFALKRGPKPKTSASRALAAAKRT
jgi:hypothetical protein